MDKKKRSWGEVYHEFFWYDRNRVFQEKMGIAFAGEELTAKKGGNHV